MSEITKHEFEEFKQKLLKFIENNFRTCSQFMLGLTECEDEGDLIEFFKHYDDEVYTRLGGVLQDEDEIDELERKIDDLEIKIDGLEGEIDDLKVGRGGTLEDEYKFKVFGEYRDQFTSWELEEIFKNGKKSLKENANNIGYSQPTLFDNER